MYYPVIFTFNAVVYFYGQQYFNTFGCTKFQISIILFLSSICACLGAISAEKIVKIFKGATKYIVACIVGVSIIIFSSGNLLTSIIFFAIINFMDALLYPIQSASLNAIIPSNQRATIISIDSMIFSTAMICLFPICGFIGDVYNLRVTFLIIGLLQLAFLSVLYLFSRD